MLPAILQIGIPGGPELLIIFMMLFLLVIPAVALALVILFLRRGRSTDEERIEELEREVAELRGELRATIAEPDEDREAN